MRRRAALAAALLSLALPAAAAGAECPQTTLSDVENEVMCPVCGTPLALATEAPQAERQRELIRRLLDDCKSKEQIKAALVAEYGDNVLSLPGDDGFDLAAYVVPALAVLLGCGLVAAAALGWRRTRRGPGGPDDPTDSASRRLQSDLERYEL